MTTYDVGDRVTLTVTITNADGELRDPSDVALRVRRPDGTVTTPSPTNPSVGVYLADVDVDQAGEWNYRWVGTGSIVVAEEGQFYVRPRRA